MLIEFGGSAHEVPDGALIGCVSSDRGALDELVRAAGDRSVGPLDTFVPSSRAELVGLSYALDLQHLYEKVASETALVVSRQNGATVLLASSDFDLLRRVADEVWWIENGDVLRRGHPAEVLPAFEGAISLQAMERDSGPVKMPSTVRRGDRRARLLRIETLNGDGKAVSIWHSGQPAGVKVVVQYDSPVDTPVVGIMIRTRIGMEVYGTNTELENVVVGPCATGDIRTVTFSFGCMLCPQSYTITAASHDPDGVLHDWIDDAIAVSVAGTRYTAGVADLRAAVTCSRE